MKPTPFQIMRANRRHDQRRAVHREARDLISVARAMGYEDSEMLIDALEELECRRDIARHKIELPEPPVKRWWHFGRAA